MLNAYNKYGFLFKRTAISKGLLNQLLSVDAFVRQLDLVYGAGKYIDEPVLFDIAESVFFPLHQLYNTEGFLLDYKARLGQEKYVEWRDTYGALRSSVRYFSQRLLGSRDAWHADYEAWLFAHTNQ